MAIQGALHGLRTRAGFNVEIKLEGDWIRFNSISDRLGPTLGILAKEAQEEFAETYRKRVQANIRNGGKKFGFPPLSPRYLAYKTSRGGREDPLYWSGAMHDAIEVLPLSGGRVGVGIRKNITRANYPRENSPESNRLTISEYANILEHGTRGGLHIPARPVFGETFKKDMKGMAGLKAFIANEVMVKANARGIPIRKL